MVSCDGGPAPTRYNLTMAVDPPGSGTAIDVTGAGAYEAGAVVDIEAIANPGYQFVIWSTTGGTLGDENAAATTFTMPALNVTVTAHFVGPLDHFKCYLTYELTRPYIGEVVYLEDQFVAINATVGYPADFCNPVEKYHDGKTTPISNDDHHLTLYTIDYEAAPQTRLVEVTNQFGTQNLTVSGPVGLAIPTQKVEPGNHEAPLGLDHFLLYLVEEVPPVEPVDVVLNDQFGGEPDALVYEPVLLANPVRKTHGTEVTEIMNPENHLVFYEIEGAALETQVQVVNQFGDQTLDLIYPELLAVPSQKTEILPLSLDHFKCYYAEPIGPPFEEVILEDQFGIVQATVMGANFFCNPVEKYHDGKTTPISNDDHHLTLYTIDYEAEPQTRLVEITNQFGTQQLTVSNPVGLAVPTHKLTGGTPFPPVGLDHYLLYEVIDGPPVEVTVGLEDQFGDEEVLVMEPFFFANPVRKTHGTEVTEIENPQAHLVLYVIVGGAFGEMVEVDNQFGLQALYVGDPALLAVPSVKLSFEPVPD